MVLVVPFSSHLTKKSFSDKLCSYDLYSRLVAFGKDPLRLSVRANKGSQARANTYSSACPYIFFTTACLLGFAFLHLAMAFKGTCSFAYTLLVAHMSLILSPSLPWPAPPKSAWLAHLIEYPDVLRYSLIKKKKKLHISNNNLIYSLYLSSGRWRGSVCTYPPRKLIDEHLTYASLRSLSTSHSLCPSRYGHRSSQAFLPWACSHP